MWVTVVWRQGQQLSCVNVPTGGYDSCRSAKPLPLHLQSMSALLSSLHVFFVESNAFQALADGLRGHSALRELWLSSNRFGDRGLQALCQALYLLH